MSQGDQPLAKEGYALMGAEFEVHNVIGGGLLEEIYQQSLMSISVYQRFQVVFESLLRLPAAAQPPYISYQRVCCYFSVIPATNGSGFSEPSGSSKLAAAQPPYGCRLNRGFRLAISSDSYARRIITSLAREFGSKAWSSTIRSSCSPCCRRYVASDARSESSRCFSTRRRRFARFADVEVTSTVTENVNAGSRRYQLIAV